MNAQNEKSEGKIKNFYKIFNFINEKFINTTTITVLITALLGPFAIQHAVNKIEAQKLETNLKIEDKKLQTQVIGNVLTFTDKADFNEPSQIIKAGFIAKIVNENENVFGLKFSTVEKDFDRLAKNIYRMTHDELKKTLREATNEINTVNVEITNKEKALSQLRKSSLEIQKKMNLAVSLSQREKDSLIQVLEVNNNLFENLSREKESLILDLYTTNRRYLTELKNLESEKEKLNNKLEKYIKGQEYMVNELKKLEINNLILKNKSDSLQLKIASLENNQVHLHQVLESSILQP